MTARIVAGVDCSPASPDVLRWASGQASLRGAQLCVLGAVGNGLPEAAAGRGRDVESSMRAALTDVIAATLGRRVATEPGRAGELVVRVSADAPADALVAESADAELIVIGKHRRRPGLPLGSTTTKVASRASCPVAVIPPVIARPADRTGRIVVGVDASALSSSALRWAVAQAQLTGWEITALMAWEWAPTYAMHPYDAPPEEIRWQCEEDLSAQLASLPKDVTIRTDIRQGRPADLLLAASRDADVLVVGSSGMGAARALLLGSVSRHVVHHAKVPVVVTHAHDHPPVAGTGAAPTAGVTGQSA